jgi:hypothetical protein
VGGDLPGGGRWSGEAGGTVAPESEGVPRPCGGAALNRLRMVLVGCAAVAASLLAADGRYAPALLLGAGIVAHGLLWVHLRRLQVPDSR